jgi:quinol-cytochrome oxidoreductase complex cytochrome b subunit
VKKLSDDEKNQYHTENIIAAELVLVDKKLIPNTHDEDIIGGGPVPKHIKPIWPFIAFTAFNTLPPEFKKIYGIKDSKFKNLLLGFNLMLLKYTRPFLPPFFRLIAPARWAKQRITKNPDLKFKDKAKY